MDSESNAAKYQVAGLKWMLELELLDPLNPAPLNALKLNVLMTSNRIKEVEFLIFREGRQMLVLLDLSWMGRKFFKREIFTDVHEVLKQMLPNFSFRITEDPKILNMAIAKVQNILGGMDEIRNKLDDHRVDDIDKSSSSKQFTGHEAGTLYGSGTDQSPKPDNK